MEGSNGLGIGGLFALHGGDDDFMAGGKLLKISVLVGLCFTWLEALGEEVVGDGFLDRLGVLLLIDDPTSELVRICGRIFGKFDDLLGCFFDGDEVGVHLSEDVVIVVDTAGYLAVSGDRRGSKKAKGTKK